MQEKETLHGASLMPSASRVHFITKQSVPCHLTSSLITLCTYKLLSSPTVAIATSTESHSARGATASPVTCFAIVNNIKQKTRNFDPASQVLGKDHQ
jgi:hypothetical protein